MHNRSWLFIASKSLAICKIVSKIYVGVNMRQKKNKHLSCTCGRRKYLVYLFSNSNVNKPVNDSNWFCFFPASEYLWFFFYSFLCKANKLIKEKLLDSGKYWRYSPLVVINRSSKHKKILKLLFGLFYITVKLYQFWRCRAFSHLLSCHVSHSCEHLNTTLPTISHSSFLVFKGTLLFFFK